MIVEREPAGRATVPEGLMRQPPIRRKVRLDAIDPGGSRTMMRLRTILALTLLLAARPASAEDGFLDKLFGGSSRGTPPNPFASNYSSTPPTADDVRTERMRRSGRGERGTQASPLPPGRIPEE
ncbi:hypothetical protein MKK75_09660 [Methylobacterium sp. J-030]|uniref:hypothetical protein n=1 Tax=Methylobacterium sp. J-030 TaxID=2836627 RepID=UPI001FBAA342|nr:hypothetical protein [Methylobacterium sp. J-030]MCJ2069064.1 hypothetical protein [Methylobacterium sp. J-030]